VSTVQPPHERSWVCSHCGLVAHGPFCKRCGSGKPTAKIRLPLVAEFPVHDQRWSIAGQILSFLVVGWTVFSLNLAWLLPFFLILDTMLLLGCVSVYGSGLYLSLRLVLARWRKVHKTS
jgi:hypothetical protein